MLNLILVQSDTLTQAYNDKWEGAESSSNAFIQFMNSNELSFVVLGVSLIIWFVLLSYLYSVDRSLKRLESNELKK
ncbi:MAG: hypothetical protein RL177_284 [Bacteroidota bacterium]